MSSAPIPLRCEGPPDQGLVQLNFLDLLGVPVSSNRSRHLLARDQDADGTKKGRGQRHTDTQLELFTINYEER